MYFIRFQQGDSVQYAGTKEDLAKELSGKEGFVVGRVQGTEREVCVTFGNDAYIMDEVDHLARFVKRARPEGESMSKGGPDVQKRKGVGDGSKKGGKRRNQEEA